MSDITLTGEEDSVGLNEENTVGVRVVNTTTNETRTALFTPSVLREWAEMLEDVYSDEPAVELVFTPDKPLYARKVTDKEYGETVGICAAPRLMPEDMEENTDE